MIKLFTLKNQRKEGELSGRPIQKKASAAHLRIQKGRQVLM
jgi:hypothetical protein